MLQALMMVVAFLFSIAAPTPAHSQYSSDGEPDGFITYFGGYEHSCACEEKSLEREAHVVFHTQKLWMSASLGGSNLDGKKHTDKEEESLFVSSQKLYAVYKAHDVRMDKLQKQYERCIAKNIQ